MDQVTLTKTPDEMAVALLNGLRADHLHEHGETRGSLIMKAAADQIVCRMLGAKPRTTNRVAEYLDWLEVDMRQKRPVGSKAEDFGPCKFCGKELVHYSYVGGVARTPFCDSDCEIEWDALQGDWTLAEVNQ